MVGRMRQLTRRQALHGWATLAVLAAAKAAFPSGAFAQGEGALAAKRTITTLPVVAVAVDDMVGAGVVANLARPEANVTGLSLLGTEVSEKRLSLLRDTIPDLSKVAIVWNPGNASMALQF